VVLVGAALLAILAVSEASVVAAASVASVVRTPVSSLNATALEPIQFWVGMWGESAVRPSKTLGRTRIGPLSVGCH